MSAKVKTGDKVVDVPANVAQAAAKITGGVSITKDNISFDFNKDKPGDIIHLTKVSLKKSNILKNTYLYGYEFTRSASTYAKIAFMEHLKSFYLFDGEDEELRDNFQQFILAPLAKLGPKLRKLNCIVYPQSRSDLNRLVVQAIKDNTLIPGSNLLSFELLKRNVNDIQLEIDSFEEAYKGKISDEEYKKALEEAESCIIKLRRDPYFSISSIPKHIRPHVTPFLHFPDEARVRSAITGSKVLVVDDIGTTGATVLTCCRAIYKLGEPKNITVFTVLGNKYNPLGPGQNLTRVSHL